MKKTTNKMMKKAMGLKGFLNSMSKPKMQMGGTPMTEKQKSFAKLAPPMDKITFADKIAGAKKKGKMGMNIRKETLQNATPRNKYSQYQMGGMDNMNPLSSMLPKKPMKSMKPKMGMGGAPPNSFGLNLQPALLTKKDGMDQYYKKGGITKKKKK